MAPIGMSPNDSTGLENSGLAEEDATDAAVFGIDAKNRKHRFHTGTATVVVTDGDDVVHTEQLAREHVPQWIEYVRDEACGWVDVWWSAKGFGEGIVRAMKATRTVDELVTDGGEER